MQIKQSQKLKKQAGFGVVGALMGLMIMSLIILIFISFANHEKIKNSAKTLGNKLAMVVNATQNRLASDPTFVANTYNIKALINKSCGGTAPADYLPCGFTLQSEIYNGDVVITVKESEDGAKMDLAVVETTPIGHYNPKTKTIEPISHLAGESLLASQVYSAADTVSYKLNRQSGSITADIVGKNTANVSDIPVGTVFSYTGSTSPAGFFECNGQSYDADTYPELYKAVGSNKVPDLRGEFVRGWDHGKGVDKGRVLNSYQDDALQNIQGKITNTMTSPWESQASTGAMYASHRWGDGKHDRGSYGGTLYDINFDASRIARTADETRPKNVALMFIIKHD